MLLTALAIKLDSRGPIFYLQKRVGMHNASFRIIKFRSMRMDAEANGPVWAGESDARVTRVGRWIRKLRIEFRVRDQNRYAGIHEGHASRLGVVGGPQIELRHMDQSKRRLVLVAAGTRPGVVRRIQNTVGGDQVRCAARPEAPEGSSTPIVLEIQKARSRGTEGEKVFAANDVVASVITPKDPWRLLSG